MMQFPFRPSIYAPPLRSLLVLATALACAGAVPLPLLTRPAMAQALPEVAARVVLTEVRLVSQSATETRLRLKFLPRVNGYAEIGGGVGKLAVGFSLGSRANSAVAPTGLAGLVRGISFDQLDSVLILRFDVAGPSRLEAVAIDPGTLDLVISNGTAKAPAAPVEAPVRPDAMTPAAMPATNQAFELVRLQYADVSEVVGMLSETGSVKSNNVFSPREPGFGSNSITGGAYMQPPMQAPTVDDQPLGQSVDSSISIDRRLNAIMLKGTPERIAMLKAQIAVVDVPVESVILETQLIELTSGGAKALGIDLANANGQIATGSLQVGGNIPMGLVANEGKVLQSAGVQAAIYAQIQRGEARIVSRPRISAQNGGTAKIVTGDALPILTSIALAGVNGVSQQVQYVNVGVTLQIAPRVSSDGHVTSQIFCVVSSVSGYSQGYPTISQREAQTSATVVDGESFVIGGLTQEASINTNSKVPGLGDIPLLGQVFNTRKSSKSNSELYIIVTPHIVHVQKT